MSDTGIPTGWEFVRFGVVARGDSYIGVRGQLLTWSESEKSDGRYLVIRKIEKPKRYRHFANSAEFLAHPLSSDFIERKGGEFTKVQQCDCEGVWFMGCPPQSYEIAFLGNKFRDGTPFGVEITELET